MAEIPDDVAGIVTKKVAGLPLFVWAGAAGLTVLALSRWRQRAAAGTAAAQPQATTSGDPGADPGYSADLLPLPGAAPSTPASEQQAAAPQFAGYSDNSEWSRAVFGALLVRGYEALAIDTALAHYLNMQPMTQADAAVISAAIAAVGPPPQPMQSAPNVTAPVLPADPGRTPRPAPPVAGTPTPGQPAASGEVAPPMVLTAPLPYPWNLLRQVYGTVNAGLVGRWAAANGLNYNGNIVTPWHAGLTVKFPAGLV